MRRIIIISLVVIAVLVSAYFVLNFFFPTVRVDVANTCGWESGKMISSTDSPSKIETHRMKRSTYKRYMAYAQFNYKCILGHGVR